jgi:2-keto-4-pentenoate hydratase/2-oxohepta-3-ene-1,7-dioic acid hydratase in catechol pathway
LDSNNIIRDLSSHIQDLNPSTLNESTFTKLSQIDLSELKQIDANTRIGSCISNPVDFLAIGLNYKAHAEGTNSKLPTEPIYLIKVLDAFRVQMIQYLNQRLQIKWIMR